MSDNVPGTRPARRFSLRHFAIAALFLAPLVVGVWLYLIAMQLGRVPEFNGTLVMEAPQGSRYFVGIAAGSDYLVNTSAGKSGPAQFAIDFENLLGLSEAGSAITFGPLAVPLPDDKAKPTAADLAGDGAQLLKSSDGGSSGGAGTSSGRLSLNCKYEEWWLRRAGGELDHVFVFLLTCNQRGQAPQRFFLPVRLRPQPGSAEAGFTGSGCSFGGRNLPRFMKIFGESPEQIHIHWSFHTVKPPAEFATELAEKGLWEPRP
jgi:hypothetical protein